MVYTSKVTSSVEENFDILGSAPSSIVCPNFNTALESTLFIGSVCEEAYADLMESIGVEELRIYESTGSEVLYEDAEGKETKDGANLKEKIKGFFQKAWDAIKSVFEKVIAWFQGKIHSQKALGKIAFAWNKKKDQIKDDKTFGKAKYLIGSKLGNNIASGIFKKTAGEMRDKVLKASRMIIDNPELDAMEAMQKAGVNVDNAKNFKAFYTEKFGIPKEATAVTKKWVDENIKMLASIVVYGVSTKEIKEMYKDTKNYINATAKEAMADAAKKDVKAVIKAASKTLPVLGACNNALLDIMRARYIEANNILTSVAVACKLTKAAKEEKGEKKEEATGESAMIAAIESAFDF